MAKSSTAFPLISVCIPVFNGERYIRECIESVLQQTENKFELLVVDNCSTDYTLEIVAYYNDSRINVFKNSYNLGLIGNFNRCIELAQGEYVVILPHDDLLLPTMLATFSKIMISDPQIGLIYSAYYRINAEGEQIDLCQTDVKSRVMSGEEAFRRFMRGNPVQCAMIRKEIFSRLGSFEPSLPLTADVNMWCRIALAGYKVAYLTTQQNCYRVHPASMTKYISSKGEYGSQLFKCFQKTFDSIPSQSNLQDLRSLAARWPMNVQFVYIAESLMQGNWTAVKKHLNLLVQIVQWVGVFRVVPSLLVTLLELIKYLLRRVLRVLKQY